MKSKFTWWRAWAILIGSFCVGLLNSITYSNDKEAFGLLTNEFFGIEPNWFLFFLSGSLAWYLMIQILRLLFSFFVLLERYFHWAFNYEKDTDG